MEAPFEASRRNIDRRTGKADQQMTMITGESVHRRNETTQPMSFMYEQRDCVIA